MKETNAEGNMHGLISRYIQKYRNLNVVVKASLWFTVCNLLLKGINLISVPLFTRFMPEEEYGKLAVFMSYESIILTLATWEIALSVYRKGIYKYKDNVPFFTMSTQLYSNLITIVFFTIFFFAFPIGFKLTGMTPRMAGLMFCFMLTQPAYSCWLVRKKTEFDYKKASVMTLLYSVINVGVPMAAILMIARTAEVKFSFYLASSIVFFFPFFLMNISYTQLLCDKRRAFRQWKYITIYQLPIVMHALSFTVLAQADRIMIGHMVGNTQAAFYSVAYSLGNVISIFQNSLIDASIPWLFQKLDEKKYADIRVVTNYILIGIAVLVLTFIFISPEVMKLVFSKSYYEAVWSIPPVSLSVFFMFLYSIFVWIENYYEKTIYVMIVSTICAVSNVILNAIFINVFGYIICGYTTVVSYMLFCVGHCYFAKRICKQQKIEEKVYDLKWIILLSLATTMLTVGITLLYPYTKIRYAILTIFFAVCFFKRDRIMKMFKMLRSCKPEIG